MDSQDHDIELLSVAIKKLIKEEEEEEEEEETKNKENDDDHDKLLLSRLLSQLESLKDQKRKAKKSETLSEIVEEKKTKSDDHSISDIDKEEIVKELKKVQRQNYITQGLVSILIVITLTWQISQVSLILKLKDGLSHPFKSLGNMLISIFNRPQAIANGQHDDNAESAGVIPPLAPPPLKIPELPRMELPDFGANGKKMTEERITILELPRVELPDFSVNGTKKIGKKEQKVRVRS